MKRSLIVVAFSLLAHSAFAAPQSTIARVYTGFVDSRLAPFGAMVNIENGEVLYVTSVISTLAPTDLKKDCKYQITYTETTGGIQLVPPMKELSCGNRFAGDR